MKHTIALHKRYLVVLLAALCTTTAIFVAGGALLQLALVKHLESEGRVLTRALSTMVDRVMQEPHDLLKQLSLALGIDPGFWHERLETRIRVWPYFENIHILDTLGRVQMVVPPDANLLGSDYSRADHFVQPYRFNAAWWSPVFISPATGRPAMKIAVPFSQGVVVGVVRLDELSRHVGGAGRFPEGCISIADRVGSYIVHHDSVRVMQRASATRLLFEIEQQPSQEVLFYKEEENGTNMLVSAMRLPRTGWFLIFSRSEETVYAPLRIVVWVFIPLMLILLVAIWIAFRRISRELLRSIDSFTAHAAHIAQGDFTQGDIVPRLEEFSGMARIFNEMRHSVNRREQEVLESEERYRVLVELSPEAIVVVHEGRFAYVNPAAVRIFGAGRAAVMTGEKITGCLPGDETGRYSPFASESGLLTKASFVFRRLDGTPFEAEVSTIAVTYDGRESVLAIINDISERRRIERELDAMNHRFRNAVESMEDGLWDWNVGENTLYVSPRYCQIFGYTPGDMPLKDGQIDWRRLVHPDDRERVNEAIIGFLAHPERVYRCETRMRHRDGHWLQILSRGRVVEQDSVGRPVRAMGTIMDMTPLKRSEEERVRLESQLRQEQKLSSVGTLANGVAHEINNPLMGMINYAQLLHDRIPESEEIWRSWSSEIISEGLRISEIVRNLLTFSRQSDVRRIPVSPAEVISGILSLSRKLLEKDEIQADVDLEADLPLISCSAAQIQQVLLNLLTNARDALNERHPGYSPDKRITITGSRLSERDGVWVRISVADRGCGLPAEASERIFDPFFTTKPTGLGTGLGLSISYGIVKEHGGHLGFEHNEPEGTVFHVDLPAFGGDRPAP